MAEMSMVEKVQKAIDAVQCFSRFNDWTDNRVEGVPIEICRYGKEGEEGQDGEVGTSAIIVIRRFSADADETNALYMVVSEMRARAAIEAMRDPTEAMQSAAIEKIGYEVDWVGGLMGSAYGAGVLVLADAYRASIEAALSEEVAG